MSNPSEYFRRAGLVLEEGVKSGAFPAAAAEAGSSSRAVWQACYGTLTGESGSAHATLETLFDLASLTKPVVTTTICMTLGERGVLRLDDRVADWLSRWRGADREHVTIADLLAHTGGLTAHLPLYRDSLGRREFEATICALPLEYAPRTRALYSDLGFMLLAFLLEDAAGQSLDRLFEQVLHGLPGSELLFRPSPNDQARSAPTGLDRWRGRVLTGEVHDRNAWALGGVAGHAGLFGTVTGVGMFARALLGALEGGATFPVSPSTVKLFCARSRVPGSSRALGWDTMLPTSSCGMHMSTAAVGHTGFTGTSLWIDPTRNAYAVLLTNRVHPDDTNDEILRIRPRFHDAVFAAWNHVPQPDADL